MKNDHHSEFSNLSNWKEEGFNGIRTRDLRDTAAQIYELFHIYFTKGTVSLILPEPLVLHKTGKLYQLVGHPTNCKEIQSLYCAWLLLIFSFLFSPHCVTANLPREKCVNSYDNESLIC